MCLAQLVPLPRKGEGTASVRDDRIDKTEVGLQDRVCPVVAIPELTFSLPPPPPPYLDDHQSSSFEVSPPHLLRLVASPPPSPTAALTSSTPLTTGLHEKNKTPKHPRSHRIETLRHSYHYRTPSRHETPSLTWPPRYR